MIFFESSTWPLAIIGLSPTVVKEVEYAALMLSSMLPAEPTVDHLAEVSIISQLGLLNQTITAAREQSMHPEHWPEGGIPDVNLALWAMGLSTHILTRRKFKS